MIRTIILSSIIFVLAYMLYVLPVFMLKALFTGSAVVSPAALFPTVLAFGLVRLYLATGITNRLLKGFVYYGMGIGFLAVMILPVVMLVKAVAGLDGMLAGWIGVICLGAVTAVCLFHAKSLSVRRLTLTSDRIDRPVTLAFISDVHIGSNPPAHLGRICDRLGKLEFDGLLIGGDLFDSSDFRFEDIAPLGGLATDIYFVTGNHEGYVKGYEAHLARFGEFGIRVLDNEAADFQGINLIGVGDEQPPASRVRAVDRLYRDGRFNIALVHQPSIWDKTGARVELMLCGHTHNGQIFPFNFLVRLQFRHVYGLFTEGASNLYVSSGCGCWGPRMRLGSRNEIVLITLRPA